ncbi:hypothetical protein D3C83_66550 [compost metagenome]
MRLHPFVNALIDDLELVERQFIERFSGSLGSSNRPTGNMMGFAERHTRLPRQPVGKIRCGRVAGGCRPPHPLRYE